MVIEIFVPGTAAPSISTAMASTLTGSPLPTKVASLFSPT